MPLTHDQAYALLQSAKRRNRMGHAFLLSGEAGSGKKSLAAALVHLLQPDPALAKLPPRSTSLESLQGEYVRIVKPRLRSRQISVKDIRELEDSFYLSAPPGQWKVGVIIDADRMHESAANAFLKTLEEPPAQSLLLLLTTAPDQLLSTIQSRCISLALHSPSRGEPLTETQQFVADLLETTLSASGPSIIAALRIKQQLEHYLKAQKEALSLIHRDALKEETKLLKNTVEREYLKAKEEEAKALESSQYQAIRAELLHALIRWMGDVVRLKVHSSPQHQQHSRAALLRFSEASSLEQLLQRLAALEELLSLSTGTNVHEALSLEVYLMNAFS